MNQQQLLLFMEHKADGDNHKTQRGAILKLLRTCSFVRTKTLVDMGFYQYNARILELRRSGHDIISCKQEGLYGFVIKQTELI